MPDNESPSYDIPTSEIMDDMSPEEAKLALGSFEADIKADGMLHPFLDPNHPQHKDTAAYHRKLLELTSTDNRTVEGKVHEDMYQRTVEKEQGDVEKLKEQAAIELSLLKKLNFDTETNMPEVIEPYHISAWQRQRLLAEGNFSALGESLKSSLDPNAVELVSALLNNSYISPESKEKHLELIIADVFAGEKANYEASRKPSLSELKTQMAAESNQQEVDSVLEGSNKASEITEEINRIESTPGLFDTSQKGLKFQNRAEFDRLVEERDRLYRARAEAQKGSDRKLQQRASSYKPGKYGR